MLTTAPDSILKNYINSKPDKMETRKHLLPIAGSILVLLLVIHSCSPAKRSAVSCTEFPVYKSNRTNHHTVQKLLAVHPGTIKKNRRTSSENKQFNNIVSESRRSASGIAQIGNMNKTEFSGRLLASSDNNIVPFNGSISDPEVQFAEDIYSVQIPKCDTIILRSGSVIYGKVEEIGQTEIKYRKCNNLNGPLISIAKTEVSSIRYINGTRENLNESVPQTYTTSATALPQNNLPRQNEGLSVAGFLASIIGLFIASIPLGLLAVIFGGISLSRIRKNPSRYKGKGLAIASIIIGIIDVVVMIALLSSGVS